MAHAFGTGSITLGVYSKVWWEERVDAVTQVVEAVFTEPEEQKEDNKKDVATAPPLPTGACDNGNGNWVPFWVPQGARSDRNSTQVVKKNGRP